MLAPNWTLIIHPDFNVNDELKQKLSKLLSDTFSLEINTVRKKPNDYEPIKNEDYFFVYLEVTVDDRVNERIAKVESYIEKSLVKLKYKIPVILANKQLDIGNRKWIVIYQKRVHFTVFYHFDSKKQDFYKQIIDSSRQEVKQVIVEAKKELMILTDKQLKFLTRHIKSFLDSKKVECKFTELFVQPQDYPTLYIFNKMDGEMDPAREKLLKDLKRLLEAKSKEPEKPKIFIVVVEKVDENRIPNRGRDFMLSCPFNIHENSDGILTSYSVDQESVLIICEKLEKMIFSQNS